MDNKHKEAFKLIRSIIPILENVRILFDDDIELLHKLNNIALTLANFCGYMQVKQMKEQNMH